ncbi:hypothetical protein ACP70R_015578 [Stipagrostis hirtigluma subsp. patula]
MDDAACSKCGDHLLEHTSCYPEIERHRCCNACLLEAKPRQEQIPSWVGDLAAVDFSALCRKNRFCPTCLVGFCGRRCPTAELHAAGQRAKAIEIHVLGEDDSLRTFVDVMEVHGLCDCSEIQLEIDLAPAPSLLRRLVPLHPMGKRCAKNYCGSIRIGDERLYCSMECEVQWRADKGLPGNQFIKALLAEDFTTGHQRDAFCISCRVAFCTPARTDHASHPSVKIVSNGGQSFARVPAMEEWLRNFDFVLEDGEGYALLPLTPPPPQNSWSVAT